MNKKEIQNISQIKQVYLLSIKEINPELKKKMKIKLISEQTNNEWFRSNPGQNKPIALIVDSKKLIIEVYDKSIKNTWKILGRGIVQYNKKYGKIYSLSDKKLVYDLVYNYQKEVESDSNSLSNIFQNVDNFQNDQQEDQENIIRKIKTLDESLNQHLVESSYQRIVFNQMVDESTSFIANMQNQDKTKIISLIKQQPLSEQESKMQQILINKLDQEKEDGQKLCFKSLSLHTRVAPKQLIISIIDNNKQQQFYKLNSSKGTKIWNCCIFLPYQQHNSFTIKYFHLRKQYACFFGRQQLKKGSSTIYDFDGNSQGYAQLKFTINREINIQTNQMLQKQIDQIYYEEQKETLNNIQKKEDKKQILKDEQDLIQKLENIEIKLQKNIEPEQSVVKIDVQSSIQSQNKDYFKQRKRPHLKKFTQVDVKISPQVMNKSQDYEQKQQNNDNKVFKRSNTNPQTNHNFRFYLHQIQNMQKQSGQKKYIQSQQKQFSQKKQKQSLQKSQRIHELNVFSVQNLKKSNLIMQQNNTVKINRRDQVNFKIISISLKLDTSSFEGKYLEVSINGKKPYITSTSKQTMFHSWISTSYYFQKVSIFSSLLIKVYSTNNESNELKGQCKMSLMELPWQNGNLLKEYEDYVRQKSEQVLGKIHFVYEFSDFKRNNLLSSISQSTKIQKKFDTITSKNIQRRALRKRRNNTQISISQSKKQKINFKPYKKIFQSDQDKEFFHRNKYSRSKYH